MKRERERESEKGRERGGGDEGGGVRGNSSYQIIQTGQALGFAPFTNRTRFSNAGSPNLTSKHRGSPD